MENESFGKLLRKYRERAKDPYAKTSRTLSQDRLADLVREKTRRAISPQQISAWEQDSAAFPSPRILDGIISVLRDTGGIQTIDEINALNLAAGYQPVVTDYSFGSPVLSQTYPNLTNQDMINAIYTAAGGDYWDWITRAGLIPIAAPAENRTKLYSGPAVRELDNLTDSELDALEKALTPLVDRGGSPPLAIPEDEVEFTHRDTRIRVARIANAWLLKVDTLALIAAGTLDQMGGVFYENLLTDLKNREDDTDVELDEFINDTSLFPSDLRNDNPVFRALPQDLGSRVLPYAEEGRAGVFIITRKASKDDPVENFEESLRIMVESVVRVAAENDVHSVALPLVGSGSGGQMPPVTVSRIILETLRRIADFGSLTSITLVTITDEVIPAARKLFNLLNFNRAQDMLNDEPVGRDLLGIEEEVHALSESLVLRDVDPPLAVGILGGWGTGKSFIMHLMQQKLSDIRTRKVIKGWPKDENDLDANIFAGHIYQIRFNAWTYAKSNLWASLMQTIFFELNRQLSLELFFVSKMYHPLEGNQIYKLLYEPQMRSQMETNGNALWVTMRALKQEQLENLRKTEQLIREQKEQRGKFRAARILRLKLKKQAGDALSEAVKTVLQDSGEISDDDMETLKSGLGSLSGTSRRLWQIYQQNPVKLVGLLLLVLLLLAGSVLIGWLLSGTMQWLPAALVTIAGLLQRVMPEALRWSGQVNQMLDAYEYLTEDELEDWEAVWQKELEKDLPAEEQKVAEQTDRIDLSEEEKLDSLKNLAKAGNLAAIDHYLAFLEGQAHEHRRLLGPTADYVSLVDFVQARLDEKDYENKLGLMHQVKQDLDDLTDGLVIQDWDDENVVKKKKKLFPRGKARVVLYIDDLDRCQPKRVVEVMEAVQLLLRTRLFVVVLGLDTRYVTRALEKEYKEILQREGDPSGLDYIEKIIQIPYRVRPIEKDGLKNYLTEQMDVQLTESGETESPSVRPLSEENTPNVGESVDEGERPVPTMDDFAYTYPGLYNQGIVNIFHRVASAQGESGSEWLDRADLESIADSDEARIRPYRGPIVDELSGLTAEERSALVTEIGNYQETSGRPYPELPERKSEITLNGVTIRVAKTERAWLMPVDTLAIPPAASLEGPGGSFYGALLDDISKRFDNRTRTALFDFLEADYPQDLREENPQFRRLPDDLGGKVLPFAHQGSSGIFLARKGSHLDYQAEMYAMIGSLIRLAEEHHVRSIALPLFGTSGDDPDSIEHAGRGIVRAMVALVNEIDCKTLKTITIVTIEDNVVDASQEIIQQLSESDLSLEVIRFQSSDRRDLAACCNLIQLTPRSVKRLVNVFKLIKIFWFRKYGGDKPRREKQTMLGLLALSAGYPEIMREIFVEFDTDYRDPSKAEKTMSELMEGYLKQIHSPNRWQVDRFEKDFRALLKLEVDEEGEPFEFFKVTIEKFEQPTFNLVRSFSFVGDPTFAVNPDGDEPPLTGTRPTGMAPAYEVFPPQSVCSD